MIKVCTSGGYRDRVNHEYDRLRKGDSEFHIHVFKSAFRLAAECERIWAAGFRLTKRVFVAVCTFANRVQYMRQKYPANRSLLDFDHSRSRLF